GPRRSRAPRRGALRQTRRIPRFQSIILGLPPSDHDRAPCPPAPPGTRLSRVDPGVVAASIGLGAATTPGSTRGGGPGQDSAQTPSSLPLGSVKWKRRPPGKG